jgi:hypothetical protein
LPSDKNDQKIPKSIHLAWIQGFASNQSRCISQDMMEIPKTWMEQFPSYNIYFQNDEAVDALFAKEWPEFPQLTKIMNACVRYGGVMRTDLWCLLVVYRYGGFYTDFDMGVGSAMDESVVDANDTALFLSDPWMWPTQYVFAMEPKHPVAYFTMLNIFKGLMALKDVSMVKLVFLTGPDALKFGYWRALDPKYETCKKTFTVGYHTGRYGKRIQKLGSGPNLL